MGRTGLLSGGLEPPQDPFWSIRLPCQSHLADGGVLSVAPLAVWVGSSGLSGGSIKVEKNLLSPGRCRQTGESLPWPILK